ncbi:MAG: MoxR-like ATPase [Myxococcota bacterium]|jgi:MoxR-like ATPase
MSTPPPTPPVPPTRVVRRVASSATPVPPARPRAPASPIEAVHEEQARAALVALRDEVATVVVGQDGVVTGLITALLVRGHVLLEGVPGVAKTLLVKTLAQSLELETARIQCTPDLMPADVTGQPVLDATGRATVFKPGPVFTNLLLADELNRTPPKTQSALLEAMEERQVSVEGQARGLPDPFLVIATQNPVEQEGTYPLPEAQLDRFLMKLTVGYPTLDEEDLILARHDQGLDPHDLSRVRPVAGVADLQAGRAAVQRIEVDPAVRRYIVELCRATRTAPAVSLGVSPRGATMLLHAAKAWAWLAGRTFLSPDEIKAVARPALRHRILLRPEAALEGATTEAVLERVLATVPVPR